MSQRRPDRDEWLHKLGLASNAAPFEILARSFGKCVADTYEMFAEPEVDLAADSLRFLAPVHGLKYQSAEARELVDHGRLKEGAILRVVAEPNNSADARAQAVFAETGDQLGYVPAPVLDYVEILGQSGSFVAQVTAVNASSDGLHFRALMRLEWRALTPGIAERMRPAVAAVVVRPPSEDGFWGADIGEFLEECSPQRESRLNHTHVPAPLRQLRSEREVMAAEA